MVRAGRLEGSPRSGRRLAESRLMADRAAASSRTEPGSALPAFDRLAPPAPTDVVAARIEAHTLPGDIVLDLHGRGGWIARAAIDRQRRAVSLETNPLTRLLAEVVLRPPDLRHLDAAFGAIAAAPRRDTSLKLGIGDLYATRCPTCGRMVVADELIWETPVADPDGWPRPIRRHWRCSVCRAQQGGGEHRQAAVEDDDLARALAEPGAIDAIRPREGIADRFPVLEGGEGLVDELLDLHTPRQLVGLAAILERIDADLRSAPVEAALRIALLHALLPASRLNAYPGRVGSLRIGHGHVRPPSGAQWRERNPWLAFEDGYRLVRTFVARVEGGLSGPLQARFGDDLRSVADGPATASVRLATASAYRTLLEEGRDLAPAGRSRVRLVLAQPPARPSVERLSFAYFATGWVLGREAAALLPLEPLFGPWPRVPWGWQAAAVRRSLEAAETVLARDGRAVLLVEPGGIEAIASAVLGGVGAGYRLVGARLGEPGDDLGGTVELSAPGATLPPGPRSRANVPLGHTPGGAGDPNVVQGRGLFAPPERIDVRAFSAAEAARQVTETAVEVLKARGEPARTEQLVGEALVGLDRAGLLRRLVAGESDRGAGADGGDEERDGQANAGHDDAPAGEDSGRGGTLRTGRSPRSDPPDERRATGSRPGSDASPWRRMGPGPGSAEQEPMLEAGQARGPGRRLAGVATDPVERLVALVRDELARPDQRRLTEVAPGRWWLADRADRDAAAAPLADRVEWAVYSLLSTAGNLSEGQFYERIAALFAGPDLPDEAIVRACLESYRSMASTPDHLLTSDDLVRRSHEHAELLTLLADLGHRLGLSVWLAEREQGHRLDGRPLGDWLGERERAAYLPAVVRGNAESIAEVDAIWYVRGRLALLFEVEWTAMLGDPVLRRHARIVAEESTVRFLVAAPERTELIRAKLNRSPLLRAAFDEQNWHVLKWNHLRTLAGSESPSLDALEPLLGLDPVIERTAEQMPLFGG